MKLPKNKQLITRLSMIKHFPDLHKYIYFINTFYLINKSRLTLMNWVYSEMSKNDIYAAATDDVTHPPFYYFMG